MTTFGLINNWFGPVRAIGFVGASLLIQNDVLAEDSLTPPGAMKALEAAVLELSKSGRPDEVLEVVDLMQHLGLPLDEAARLVERSNGTLAKARKSNASSPRAERQLRKAAKLLFDRLDYFEEDSAYRSRGRLILRLDDSIVGVHKALEHVREGAEWISEDEANRRRWRTAMNDAITAARNLDIEITTRESSHPTLVHATAESGACATWKRVHVHSCSSEPEAERILREALRSVALVNYLLRGRLGLPKLPAGEWILVDSEAAYQRAVQEAIEGRGITGLVAQNAHEVGGFFDSRGHCLLRQDTEADITSTLFCYLSREMILDSKADARLWNAQPCLTSAIQNWIAMVYLGWHRPTFSGIEVHETEKKTSRSKTLALPLDEASRIRREEAFRLAKAGIVGCRSFLSYLAEQREDPPFREAMVEDSLDLAGVELMKATLVAEFLAEDGRLLRSLLDTHPERQIDHTLTIPELFERSLGVPLVEFETRWREWIVPSRGCLADRVASPREERAGNPDQQSALDHLNRIRRAALGEYLLDGVAAVGIDDSLSEGARLHALYLAKNPAQLKAWPDAHEEYADADGFTPMGAWAGGHSVIAPQSRSSIAAIDSWMGTFYHRVPLLRRGLLKIGLALEKGTAVLDSGSLVEPPEPKSFLSWDREGLGMSGWSILWPHDGMKDVPTRFDPELPNPVPGQSQKNWGYPITLMLPWSYSDVRVVIAMRLHEDSAQGPAVDCWYSTPGGPTNPELSPSDAWCLIPKSRLRARSTYHVIAEIKFTNGDQFWVEEVAWSFKT